MTMTGRDEDGVPIGPRGEDLRERHMAAQALPFNKIAAQVHDNAIAHGWWDSDRNMGEIIANIHSEATEAWMEWVKDQTEARFEITVSPDRVYPDDVVRDLHSFQDWASYTADAAGAGDVGPLPEGILDNLIRAGIAKPCGLDSELIDIIIRCLDALRSRGVDIDEMLRIKMLYNEGRPYKHGGRRA